MAGGSSHTFSRESKSKILIGRTSVLILAFTLGCVVTGSLFLSFALVSHDGPNGTIHMNVPISKNSANQPIQIRSSASERELLPEIISPSSGNNRLHGVRILIAIAAYDFSQLPHLEEVVDGYQDLCTTGASKVDVIIHTTVPYPVTLIDLWNNRLIPGCKDIFSITVIVKSPAVRLHLVDCHRPLFYERLDMYDLFIYTEDDIRVTPRAVAAYLEETDNIEKIVGKDRASDYNVGVVRYEYNYPSNVVIDDKTRHATQNVTRVYWEHGQYPIFNKAVDMIRSPEFEKTHVYMKNHHQGMFLATRDLLQAWKTRKNCEFHIVTNRPGMKKRPSQPAEGTQRVWMSSQMLYGSSHCNVQQMIPIASFGTLTLLHLPNKNYRRVGHFRNRTFSDGTEKFDTGVAGSLLTAMRLHLEIQQKFKRVPSFPYTGIQMVDECSCKTCDHRNDCSPLLQRRMEEFQAYVERGAVLTEDDMSKTSLV